MHTSIRILLTGYEAAPFFKRGGLGDVLGSLPKALSEVGTQTITVIPYYKEVEKKGFFEKIGQFSVVFGKQIEHVSIHRSFFPKTRVPIYFLRNRNLSVINIRGRNKKIDQFAFFDLAVVEFAVWLSEHHLAPSLIHCNDWHTSLIPLIMRKKQIIPIPTILTIHNLSYQGWGSRQVLDLLHIEEEEALELTKKVPATEINILGEGILHASAVSTVSPTYAEEITQRGMHEAIYSFIRRREKERGYKDRILGILNGIDYDVWNPETDINIPSNYSVHDVSRKEEVKKALLKRFGLTNKPTFCFIGRMATQKGLDLLAVAINRLMDLDINLILLGSGEKNVEKMISKIAKQFSNNVRVEFAFSEELAHLLYAGSDFILIPSHFEPCGLIQMIAMRYGTIPIASATGGLVDSIRVGRNGFLFENGSQTAFVSAIEHVLSIYHKKNEMHKLRKQAMETDFSWEKSALLYQQLYNQLLKTKSF